MVKGLAVNHFLTVCVAKAPTVMILMVIDYRSAVTLPEQVSAEADDRVSGGVQADVTLESGSISVPLAFRASSGPCSASAARDTRSSGGRAVTRAPLLLCGLHPLALSLNARTLLFRALART